MSTQVDYWAVGSTARADLPITTSQISAHLLADWLPAVPSAQSRAFMGWPQHVLRPLSSAAGSYLSIDKLAGQAERQWKGFISWMLGVAGARQVLANEGYRWIAPCSAFYPEAIAAVATPSWHRRFPRTRLSIIRQSGSKSRLRPDYVAIRQSSSGLQWAVAESKGTSRSLSSMVTCSRSWREQVRNVQVLVDGTPVRIPRHIVVATRVNPGARRSSTRKLQVRAWNSAEDDVLPLPKDAAVEVATAFFFGLLENLNLPNTAHALALAARARADRASGEPSARRRAVVNESQSRSTAELDQRLRQESDDLSPVTYQAIDVETDVERITVAFDPATVTLIRTLVSADEPNVAAEALVKAEAELSERKARPPRHDGVPELALPSGIVIEFPGRRPPSAATQPLGA